MPGNALLVAVKPAFAASLFVQSLGGSTISIARRFRQYDPAEASTAGVTSFVKENGGMHRRLKRSAVSSANMPVLADGDASIWAPLISLPSLPAVVTQSRPGRQPSGLESGLASVGNGRPPENSGFPLLSFRTLARLDWCSRTFGR